MALRLRSILAVVLSSNLAVFPAIAQDEFVVPLPAGVKVVWDVTKADREATAMRGRVCINGLWRWRPAAAPVSGAVGNQGGDAEALPDGGWGYFKVPGCWPGITDYMQKDCQTVFTHPGWKDQRLADVSSAWYQREITIPDDWRGRRIELCVECLNSQARVYVDGNRAGELRFPGGALELTPLCRPGATHRLTLCVTALPLKAVLLSYTDTNAAREVKGRVARRGLCGDVFLVATPAGPRIGDVKVDTSVRKKQVTFAASLHSLAPDARYSLHAKVTAGDGGGVTEFRSMPFGRRDLHDGSVVFADDWLPDRLWDIHTPQNVYDVTLTLEDADGKELDTTFRGRFGFREFWIDGRDFHLNGTRAHLSAVPD